MFEDTLIVQSAISAFNNAALVAPAFLWWGLLAIPLFVLIYYCGTSALARIGWNENNINSRVGLITVVLTLAWVVLFGGNYQVLRDSSTVLPFAVAAIHTVPTGFSAVPPPGPAMPDVAMAQSVCSNAATPSAICLTTGSLTAPSLSRMPRLTPNWFSFTEFA